MGSATKKPFCKDTSFEAFYNRYFPEAIRYAAKKIRSVPIAEDIVCDTFLYCYDHFYAFDEKKASQGTWFYLILNSRIKNYYRDKKQFISFDLLEDVIDESASYVDQTLAINELRSILADALNTLSDTQRTIVILRYFQGLNTTATASRVGISESNVRTQLSRALVKIKGYFEKMGYGRD